jgi:hypothetical protein
MILQKKVYYKDEQYNILTILSFEPQHFLSFFNSTNFILSVI